jgi:hypothetical protein
VSEHVEQRRDQLEVEPAHESGVLADQGVERAVREHDGVTVDARLVAVSREDAGDVTERPHR